MTASRRSVDGSSHVLIIHEVEDYQKWKAVFDGAATLRGQAGEIEYQLLTFDADERQVVHFSRWTSLKAARTFFESAQLAELRKAAGVRAPEFFYLNQVETALLQCPADFGNRPVQE